MTASLTPHNPLDILYLIGVCQLSYSIYNIIIWHFQMFVTSESVTLMFIPFVSCYMVEQMWHLSLCFVKSNWDIREHSSLCLMTAITAGWWQRLGPQVELTSANNIPRYHYGFWTKTHLMIKLVFFYFSLHCSIAMPAFFNAPGL